MQRQAYVKRNIVTNEIVQDFKVSHSQEIVSLKIREKNFHTCF
jgi:hypothetical protein